MKSIFVSKTFWFNIGAGVLEAINAMLDPAQQVIPPELQPLFGMIVAVGNIVLRYLTTQPVAVIPSPTS